ncbi:MAG: serine hydrolase [Alphaproteobacteria bacterium]|nr:serine hydrolase [Alphaproteobacteria bacterium]MCB9793393.1 serine hydrolase [Alphaproteobacteria bacterium]
MSRLLTALLGLLALSACKGGAGPDTGEVHDSSAPEVDTTALREALQEALPEAPSGVEGAALLVFDAEDRRVIELTVGDFDLDANIAVASASKLVSALVFLRLAEEGSLPLSATTGEVLGWEGELAGISADTLGAFTSGLPAEDLCAYNPWRSLQACVAEYAALTPEGAPGAQFEYGPVHMAVLGGMAEVATGEPWDALFHRALLEPIGITDDAVRYVTLPQQSSGEDNPLIAGGLRISTNQYAPLLALLFHQGVLDGEAWIAPELTARMGRNPYADAEILASPAQDMGFDYRYSFGSWLECEGAAAECAVISSPGAYGFTPWVDLEHGYYAILAMESDGQGGAGFSFPLAQELQPLIREALGL